MSIKRNIDFTIVENEDWKTVLRFYPKDSSVHSFDEERPKNWDEVYKTYMTFSILHYCKDRDTNGRLKEQPKIIFTSYMEEGDSLLYLRYELNRILEKKPKKSCRAIIYPFGLGTEWHIEKHRKSKTYKIEIWNENNEGYRFNLSFEGIAKFYEVLDYFLEYMLKHSQPI